MTMPGPRQHVDQVPQGGVGCLGGSTSKPKIGSKLLSYRIGVVHDARSWRRGIRDMNGGLQASLRLAGGRDGTLGWKG